MAVTATQGPLTGLPRRLVQDGIVSEKILMAALEAINGKSAHLVPYLVANRLGDARQIAIAAAHEFGVPLLDLDAVELDLDVVRLVDEKLLTKHRILPLLQRGKRLYIAVCDPTNLHALDEIKFQTTLRVEPIVVEQDKLDARVSRAIEAVDTTMSSFEDDDFDLENLEVTGGDEDVGGEVTSADVDDAPVVRFVNKVMLDAIKRGASDIHFEPYEKYYRIRLRQDGVLNEIARPPVALASKVAARLKVMARLDIAERRIPQDGRIKMRLSKNRAIDFRVNTCPTLVRREGRLPFARSVERAARNRRARLRGSSKRTSTSQNLAKPYGMILVTGPTGSGKTVSLYTGLNILNTVDRNISTAEDPAEINVPGINQVNVNPKVGLTFASALARVPAPGPRRDHGRRGTRPRDGRDRDQGRADRPLGAVDAAHERRAEDAYAPGRHGREALRDRKLGESDHRSAPRAKALRATARRPWTFPPKRCSRKGSRKGQSTGHHDLQRQGLQPVHERVQGPHRHLSGHARLRDHRPNHHGRRQRDADRGSRPRVEGVADLRRPASEKSRTALPVWRRSTGLQSTDAGSGASYDRNQLLQRRH